MNINIYDDLVGVDLPILCYLYSTVCKYIAILF